jgi:cytochrome oxidase assembly protein ShyY1
MTGNYQPSHYWLLDNQVKNAKVGFDVIMPFAGEDKILFVNRGWVQGDLSRQSLPEVDTISSTVTIIGRVYIPTRQQQLPEANTWPKIIGSTDLASMAESLSVENPGGILRLQGDSPGALLTGWPEINVSVEKHHAYAVQWFAMAAALLIFHISSSSNIFQWLGKMIIKRNK